MKYRLTSAILMTLLFIFISGCSSDGPATPEMAPSDSVSALDKARTAASEGRFADAVLLLKQMLENVDQDGSMADEALAILDDLYRAGGSDSIPVDYTLPRAMTGLSVTFEATHQLPAVPNGRHRLNVYVRRGGGGGIGALQSELAEITLRRNGEPPLLDSTSGVGQFTVDDDTEVFLSGELPLDAHLNGLYELHVVHQNGQVFDGWFIVSGAKASQEPDNLAPTRFPQLDPDGLRVAPFTTPTPTFMFEDFASPEFQPFESRRLLAAINFHPPDTSDSPEVWRLELGDPHVTSVTIGSTDGAEGVESLDPGVYRFYFRYTESRRFGPLSIVRGATTALGFVVER